MRTTANPSPKSMPRRGVLGVCLLLPFLMGGCPEFREEIVTVFETAATSALLGTEDEWAISSIVRGSLVDATIDLFFDQFRDDD